MAAALLLTVGITWFVLSNHDGDHRGISRAELEAELRRIPVGQPAQVRRYLDNENGVILRDLTDVAREASQGEGAEKCAALARLRTGSLAETSPDAVLLAAVDAPDAALAQSYGALRTALYKAEYACTEERAFPDDIAQQLDLLLTAINERLDQLGVPR